MREAAPSRSSTWAQVQAPQCGGARCKVVLQTFRRSATWPVWRDSTANEVTFRPVPKREAYKLWHDARRFERQTRQAGRQDGAIGRNGLAVLHALLFDFLNFRTGQLDPSRGSIAMRACISVRSVDRGLAKLKTAGVLDWTRRCAEDWIDGRFRLRQETNAYAVLSCSRWRGYREPPPAPPPDKGTWGDHPPLCAIDDALAIARDGGSLAAKVAALRSDPADRLAAALARLGEAIRQNTSVLSECHSGRET